MKILCTRIARHESEQLSSQEPCNLSLPKRVRCTEGGRRKGEWIVQVSAVTQRILQRLGTSGWLELDGRRRYGVCQYHVRRYHSEACMAAGVGNDVTHLGRIPCSKHDLAVYFRRGPPCIKTSSALPQVKHTHTHTHIHAQRMSLPFELTARTDCRRYY